MKKILTLIALIVALATKFLNAQTIVQDTAYGGQMSLTSQATYIVPDSTTARLRYEWSFNTNFIPAFPGAWDTVSNSSNINDTVTASVVNVPMPNPGNFYVRWKIQRQDTTGAFVQVANSNWYLVHVVPIPVVPTIDTLVVSPTSDGAIITYKFHAGFENATVHLYSRPAVGGSTYWDDTQTVIDSGINTATLTGWVVPNYGIEAYLMIENSAGADSTNLMIFATPPSGQPWVGPVDSVITDTAHAEVWFKAITNGSNITVKSYLATMAGVLIDSVTNVVTGQAGQSTVHAAFAATLASGTQYKAWNCIPSMGMCSAEVIITTQTVPTVFTLIADSIVGDPINGKVKLYGRVTVPSGQTAQVGVFGALASDVTYTNVLYATGQSSVTQGYYPNFMLEVTGVQTGQNLRFKFYGFTGTDYAESNSKLVQLIMPSDTVKPVVTSFDTADVTNTTVTVTFTATDNVGVTDFVLSLNGTVVANLPAGTSWYTYAGLTASTAYTLELQAKDAANNVSLLQTINVVTDATATVNPQAVLTSIPSYVCFGSEGWVCMNITGTNFVHGAIYTADYHDGQANDVDTIHFISSTQCQVWIWNQYHYSQVTFTVTNPGTTESNGLSTHITDCVNTGIEEISRIDRGLIKVFPNPIETETEIEVGQQGQYIISDVTGKIVKAGIIFVGKNKISMEGLTKGFYIFTTNTKLSTKLLKVGE